MVKKVVATEDPVQKELNEIKRLLVLSLIRDGASQSEIAAALGIHQTSVSRMFPTGSVAVNRPAKKPKRQ